MERPYLNRLELDERCSLEDVEVAFKQKASRTHPDLGGSKEDFQQLQQDYEAARSWVDRRPVVESSGAKPKVDLWFLANQRRRGEQPGVWVALAAPMLTLVLAAVIFFSAPDALRNPRTSSDRVAAIALDAFVVLLAFSSLIFITVAIGKRRP